MSNIEPALIVTGDGSGVHNENLQAARKRLSRGKAYKDLSVIVVRPTRGVIPIRVLEYWDSIMWPMNQKVFRISPRGMEVGAAYNAAVEFILGHPELSTWSYMLTLEEDNCPPPDGLLKLYEAIGDYAAVGGLYWTKGEGGMPMIYGDPKAPLMDFRPQQVRPETVQECNGLGMGFTLFKLDVFRDPAIPRPWFVTRQEIVPGGGAVAATQDLHFFGNARQAGHRFACVTGCKVGHYDIGADRMW